MHFKSSVLWQKAMVWVVGVYELIAALPAEERFGVAGQLRRAAVSVPSNIAEGWARESRKEKAQFLAIAQGSLAEAETLLLLVQRLRWIESEHLDPLLANVDELSRMLTSLRRRFREPPRPRP
ncbi:MAG: four helix bundle protein [Silanimonas sp.]